MLVRLSGIQWDTEVDGELQDVELPSELLVEVEAKLLSEGGLAALDIDKVTERALDKASDATGWCIKEASIEVVGQAGRSLFAND